MISRARLLVPLCVAALAVLGPASASARVANGHLTGTLHYTLDNTSGDCSLSESNDHWAGEATLDDTWQRNADGTYANPDSSVLSISGSWSHCSPQGSDAGTGSGTVNGGFDPNTTRGTQVDWGYDVTHPNSLAISLGTLANVNVTDDSDGQCDNNTYPVDYNFDFNFPMPSDGYGTVHVDTPLSYQGQDNGDGIYNDHWVGGSGCAGTGTEAVGHVTGDITVSPPSSPTVGGNTPTGSNAGSGGTHASGSAKGRGSATASSNGTVTVGSSSCAGPASCSDSTTVSGASGSAKKALVAAKKRKKSKKPKKVTYAHGKTTVAAGKTAAIKVKLSKKALALLKKAKKLKTTVTIVVSSPGEKTVTKQFKLTIKAPKGKKK